jgi:hypothetical protein
MLPDFAPFFICLYSARHSRDPSQTTPAAGVARSAILLARQSRLNHTGRNERGRRPAAAAGVTLAGYRGTQLSGFGFFGSFMLIRLFNSDLARQVTNKTRAIKDSLCFPRLERELDCILSALARKQPWI